MRTGDVHPGATVGDVRDQSVIVEEGAVVLDRSGHHDVTVALFQTHAGVVDDVADAGFPLPVSA